MLSDLKLWNFGTGALPEAQLLEGTFVLSTCQRTLVLSLDSRPFTPSPLPTHEIHQGMDAYYFLLETICGLKSKLIGENEIVGQFKEAYQKYAVASSRNTSLLVILEKLFKDAKDIRTQYLIGISQKTYASLTRRHLIQKAKADHVIVIGSGSLAEDLINQFKKKARVSICARNSQRVAELALQHKLTIIPWENRYELVNEKFIANTVGSETILWDETFFTEWKKIHPEGVFVDLGSPSVIQTNLSLDEGVVRLMDILNEGAIVEDKKREQINLARVAMLTLAQRRHSLFEEKKLNRPPSGRSPQFA
jgi:glutamyl-tRNA reductase